MAVIVIASSGSPESALIRVGGDGTAVGDFHGTIADELAAQVAQKVVGGTIEVT